MNVDMMKSKYAKLTCEFLHTHFGKDDTLFDSEYFYIDLSKELCDTDREKYDKYLEAFHILFNSDNEMFKSTLWNELIRGAQRTRFARSDFSKKEWEFLCQTQEFCKTINMRYKLKTYGTENINNPIITNRLILRAAKISEVLIFRKHFKEDGDFITFCGERPTQKNFGYLHAPYDSLYFVLEGKQTHEIMGYVGFSYKTNTQTALLEYYMFKQYRHNGYCKEAIKALCNMALNGRLFVPDETVYDYIYKKRKAKIGTIRAKVAANNITSIKTVESCGFCHESTLHNNMYNADVGIVDEKIYYLTKEML